MLSLTLSTVAFFVSSYFITRYLEDAGIATGMVRGMLIFSIALMMSFVVAWAADFLQSKGSSSAEICFQSTRDSR